jgi:hypothetical protein
MKTIKATKIETQWLATVDQGKQLEVIAVDDNGQRIKGLSYPLATILADENNETLFFEIYTEKIAIRIPLSELQRVANMARGEVHSEHWFEENAYSDGKDT